MAEEGKNKVARSSVRSTANRNIGDVQGLPRQDQHKPDSMAGFSWRLHIF
jgi:hypothetical protein